MLSTHLPSPTVNVLSSSTYSMGFKDPPEQTVRERRFIDP